MKYEIFGETLPGVTIFLDRGESIFTQSGGMTWMSTGLTMSTDAGGGGKGLLGGLVRSALTGESLFKATYTANADGQEFTASSSFPGKILALDVSQGPYVAQKNAFLCAQVGVNFDVYRVPGLGAKIFGGEGAFMQKFSGEGVVFLEIDGFAKEMELARGEKIKVSTGNVAVFEHTVSMGIERVKGFKNVIFGGEGLILTTLEGPGKVWLQTFDASSLAAKIAPFLTTGS